eukprot:g1413.t1
MAFRVTSKSLRFGATAFVASVGASTASWLAFCKDAANPDERSSSSSGTVRVDIETEVDISNWSNTNSVCARRIFYPQNTVELEKIVMWAHANKEKIRPVGTALSPNGNAFDERGMLSLACCDRVLEVDTDAKQITVEAGAKVSKILDTLSRYGLTLENFSSIQEQQIGGWTQVAAHGTGAALSSVEEQIVRMAIVTPAFGRIELSKENHPKLFRFAKVGLGALGVVSEVTLQCVPKFQLKERSYVQSRSKIREEHAKLLQEYRHVRYMWIPHTDDVVVVVSNPTSETLTLSNNNSDTDGALEPFRALLKDVCGDDDDETCTNFAEYRERILEKDPLSVTHVRKLNEAEAEYWKRSSGERVADSTDILGFECGGEQLVREVTFPCGTRSIPDLKDIDFVEGLLDRIEASGIPAPAPIEQRWTGRSEAVMSPAHSTNADDIFTWVGIIMYLPSSLEAVQRDSIVSSFGEYVNDALGPESSQYGAVVHWAKLETEETALQDRMRTESRFPVEAFNVARKRLDPHGILSNGWVNRVLGETSG